MLESYSIFFRGNRVCFTQCLSSNLSTLFSASCLLNKWEGPDLSFYVKMILQVQFFCIFHIQSTFTVLFIEHKVCQIKRNQPIHSFCSFNFWGSLYEHGFLETSVLLLSDSLLVLVLPCLSSADSACCEFCLTKEIIKQNSFTLLISIPFRNCSVLHHG